MITLNFNVKVYGFGIVIIESIAYFGQYRHRKLGKCKNYPIFNYEIIYPANGIFIAVRRS